MKSSRAAAIVLVLSVLVTGCKSGARSTVVWSPAKTTHMIGSNAHLSLLWERPIYTENHRSSNPCATLDGLLFVIGSEQPQGNLNLLAIDQVGNTKWSQEGNFRIADSSTQLFITDGLTVKALSPENGNIYWSKLILLANYVFDIFYFDGQLFVSAKGLPVFVISPDDGKVIAEYTSVDSFRDAHPHVPFLPNEDFQPIVLGEEAIIQRGDGLYSFGRVSLTTYDWIWDIDDPAISNATLIDDILFYLAPDDKIKAVNANTGELLYEVAIEPSIEFNNLARDTQHSGYYVCSDEANRILYVIMGDSRQLFALSVAE